MASELKLNKAKRIFPSFHFFKELRRGAHKTTFHVRQEDEDGNDENLCLKVLKQDFFQKARFERETELLSTLPVHPNLAEFHSASTVNFKGAKFHYLCEHFIPGEDLDDVLNSLESEPWPEQRAAKFYAELCDGLQVLHENNIIHRDLNPKNIRVTLDGRPVIIDLGVARAIDLPALTRAGDVQPGTLMYMAPEQVSDDASNIQFQTDLFAVGIMLYQSLTGSHPFWISGQSSEELKARILTSEDHLSRLKANENLSDEIKELLARLLRKEASSRPQKASEVSSILARLAKQQSVSTGISGPQLWSLIVGGISLLSASGTTFKYHPADPATQEEIEKPPFELVKSRVLEIMMLCSSQASFTKAEFFEKLPKIGLSMARGAEKFFLALKGKHIKELSYWEAVALLFLGACWKNIELGKEESISWPAQNLVVAALEVAKEVFIEENHQLSLIEAIYKFSRPFKDNTEWDAPVAIEAFANAFEFDPASLYHGLNAVGLFGSYLSDEKDGAKREPEDIKWGFFRLQYQGKSENGDYAFLPVFDWT